MPSNTPKHTAGPWTTDGALGDIGNCPGLIRHKSANCGAWVPVDLKDPANLALICAAPDLLAHLATLVDGIASGVAIPPDGAAIAAARLAISKATEGGAR